MDNRIGHLYVKGCFLLDFRRNVAWRDVESLDDVEDLTNEIARMDTIVRC
jgi:hypothetical protein